MTARRPLIAGNWKMNGGLAQVDGLAGALARRLADTAERPFDMLVCPPATLVAAVAGEVLGSPLMVGGQDCHTAESGAHTGDIAAAMLRELGASHVIVGHSERRADHGEDDATVKAKAEAALAAGLVAIVCIGETLAQRDAGETLAVNRRQLVGSLPAGATPANTVIAYEPVWAIGTGRTASPEQAQEVHAMIRQVLGESLGAEAAGAMRLLYGGSMKPGNAAELMAQPDIDGGLIGGASLKVDDFWAIAQAVQ
ncbi:triose-phosphate isomerase [Roseospirillum parvum]|uniref:Triosephosphate isomerase n=1 Tax=Roseospirillum parvum TaxID=83401 RepID=A0A1G8B5S1_9PROT|nr:triose-phosphate isomerase [Roseospirillum parvum]SDH28494.1 triosephosphate isomerase (TIM) [Roseospirillum parvum]